VLEVRGDHAQRLLLTRAGVGVDLGQPEYEHSAAYDFAIVDVRRSEACLALTRGVSEIHHVAADSGGNGAVTTECAKSARDNRTVPQGVRNHSTDKNLLRHVVGSEPRVLLAEGLARTCASIGQQQAAASCRIELRIAALAPTRGRLCERIITAV
jgi:hypothetical protein